MATIFETVYPKEFSGTRIQISRRDMNWSGRELPNNRFEHEKIDTTPHLSVRMDVPYEDTQRIGDYVDDFWSKPSPAKAKDVRLTNAQLYEYELRKAIEEAIGNLEQKWQTKLEKQVTKMITAKTKETA